MKINVVIATLLRDTLFRTLNSIKAQTYHNFVITTVTGGMNEYDARNQAVKDIESDLVMFIDDDAYVPEDHLEKGVKHFQENPKLKIMDTAIEGAFWESLGGKWARIDTPYLGIGTTLWVKRDAFLQVGGFKVDWGLGKKVKGWRSDTALLYEFLHKFGDSCYLHASDMVVYHPEKMKSSFVYDVEVRFYQEYKPYVLKHIAPVDPRLREVILQVESDPEIISMVKKYDEEKK